MIIPSMLENVVQVEFRGWIIGTGGYEIFLAKERRVRFLGFLWYINSRSITVLKYGSSKNEYLKDVKFLEEWGRGLWRAA